VRFGAIFYLPNLNGCTMHGWQSLKPRFSGLS
jgi:hypothetical protein